MHIIPLSRQAVARLRELEPLSHDSRYLPALGDNMRSMIESTINLALRRLGYFKEENMWLRKFEQRIALR